MSRGMQGKAKMPFDSQQQPQQLEKRVNTRLDLEAKCKDAADKGEEEIVVAVRNFPDAEYKFVYPRCEISIIQARLSLQGYSVDTKTVMDDKCSKLVLIVEKNIQRQREVHAERLETNQASTRNETNKASQ